MGTLGVILADVLEKIGFKLLITLGAKIEAWLTALSLRAEIRAKLKEQQQAIVDAKTKEELDRAADQNRRT